MSNLLNRLGFIDICNHWRKLEIPDSSYRDVYDGRIWNEFKVYNGKPFLSNFFTYGLMLNIDWFKPCKHVEYSVGAIYLTVLNLPRDVRFRRENVLLIGLIPGPLSQSTTSIPFLNPL